MPISLFFILIIKFFFCEEVVEKGIYSNHLFLNIENTKYPYVFTSSTIYDNIDHHFLLEKADCINNGCANMDCPIEFDIYKSTDNEKYKRFLTIYEEPVLIKDGESKYFEKSACQDLFLIFQIPVHTLNTIKNYTYLSDEFVNVHISIRQREVEKIYSPTTSTPQYILVIGVFFFGTFVIITVLFFCFISLIYISWKYKGIIFKKHDIGTKELPEGIKFENDIIEYGEMISFGSYGFIRGGMYHKKTDVGEMEIPVAIKMIVMNKVSGEKHVSHEVKIMKKLNHRNIIKCYGVKFEKNFAHIIMELCEKGDLHRCLKIFEIFPKARVKILLQIANGMDYLHEHGIVHRDLKTQNVLLNKKNDVKICDFGTAKNLNSVSQTLCGTVEYLAVFILIF